MAGTWSYSTVFFFFFFFSRLAFDNSEPSAFNHFQGRETPTHLRFYLHNIASCPNTTAVQDAEAKTSNMSRTSFGSVMIMDDPLTEGPGMTSKLVGRAQGTYPYASKSEVALLVVFNLVFREGKYKESTISILGRSTVGLWMEKETPVVGGTSVFRLAATTHSINGTTAVVGSNICLQICY